jgi:hypothetical protein
LPLSAGWRPVDPDALPALIAERVARDPGIRRVAVDGAPAAEPAALAEALIEPLRSLGRPAVHVRAETFWRDASLRFEYGREDVDSYETWLDGAALRREVLDPIVTAGTYLPRLRDPSTNRATRAARQPAEPGTVLLVSGALLLSPYKWEPLPFDTTVHLTLTPAARTRRTAADQQWSLAAFERYDEQVEPIASADVVVKVDDRRHPAIRLARSD